MSFAIAASITVDDIDQRSDAANATAIDDG